MQLHRFNVFGKIVAVRRDGTGWQACFVGDDGKRRAADFVIPDFIGENELPQYLFDLFHENATPANGDVRRMD